MLPSRFLKSKLTFISFILAAFSNNILAASITHSAVSCPTNTQLESLAKQALLATPRLTGVSIAITHPQCGNFNFTFGSANIAKHIAMTENTKVPTASNTKPILLVLLFKLMEEYPASFPNGLQTTLTDIRDHTNKQIFTADGKINLPDGSELDLVDPDFYKLLTGKSFDCKTDSVYQCPNLAAIDLHHLLIESSGLADYIRETDLIHDHSPDMLKYALGTLFSPFPDPGSQDFASDTQALKKFGLVKKANPDPIIPMQSHNTDASLLAIILERVSGQTLNTLLQQKILAPLELKADSMRFLSKPADPREGIARQYALLNTDAEIDTAIANGTVFPSVKSLVNRLKPSYLESIGRQLTKLNNDQSAIDVLDLNGQGFYCFPGPAGVVAEPQAYIQFYQALAQGKLLSAKAQTLFTGSFLPQASGSQNYSITTGYESNTKMHWTASPKAPTFLAHGGFVIGGESQVLYSYDTGMTIMIVVNNSGSYRNTFPTLFVTPTAYFGYDAIFALEMKYAALYDIL